MPYIEPADRSYANLLPRTAGELNFAITNLVSFYLSKKGTTYQTINDILGALEGAKMEFYRRVVVPYEDRKKEENGDVYPEPHHA